MIIGSVFLKSIVFHNADPLCWGCWPDNQASLPWPCPYRAEIAAAIRKREVVRIPGRTVRRCMFAGMGSDGYFVSCSGCLAIAFSTYTTFFIPLNPLEQTVGGRSSGFCNGNEYPFHKIRRNGSNSSTIAKLIPISIIILWGFINGGLMIFAPPP